MFRLCFHHIWRTVKIRQIIPVMKKRPCWKKEQHKGILFFFVFCIVWLMSESELMNEWNWKKSRGGKGDWKLHVSMVDVLRIWWLFIFDWPPLSFFSSSKRSWSLQGKHPIICDTWMSAVKPSCVQRNSPLTRNSFLHDWSLAFQQTFSPQMVFDGFGSISPLDGKHSGLVLSKYCLVFLLFSHVEIKPTDLMFRAAYEVYSKANYL